MIQFGTIVLLTTLLYWMDSNDYSSSPVWLFSLIFIPMRVMEIQTGTNKYCDNVFMLLEILISGILLNIFNISCNVIANLMAAQMIVFIQSVAICTFMNDIRINERNKLYTQSKQLYTQLYRDAPSLFITVSNDGFILNCNNATLKLIGISIDKIIHKPIYSVFCEKSHSVLKEIYQNKIHEERYIENIELHMNCADQSDHCMNASISFCIDCHEPHTLISNMILHDITNEKNTIHQLEVAKKQAEDTSRSKSVFVNTISHELRTPLTSVISHAELLLKDEFLTLEQQELVKSIHTGSTLLNTLLSDILDIGKIVSGKFHLENSEFNLRESLCTVGRVARDLVSEKTLNFEMRVDDQIPTFFIGDSIRLNQVLLNLVNNAIKFTSIGRVDVLVTQDIQDIHPEIIPLVPTDEIDTDTVQLFFQVTDTGCGIKKNRIKDLFQQFSKLQELSFTGGTGLGLAISKSLVNLMGGNIYVTSQEGLGSTFCFTVRLCQTNSGQDIKLATSPDPDNIYNLRILSMYYPSMWMPTN
jgi:two-component system sensor histidine kinase/response regulator